MDRTALGTVSERAAALWERGAPAGLLRGYSSAVSYSCLLPSSRKCDSVGPTHTVHLETEHKIAGVPVPRPGYCATSTAGTVQVV